MVLTEQEITWLFDLIKKKSGISLTKEKSYLIEPRLLPVAKHFEFKTVKELINKIQLTSSEDMILKVIDSMTTNESSFFRDFTPFENFSKIVIPHLKTSSPDKSKLRIWSAAASTGQEPYSILIKILEEGGGIDSQIIATDICEPVLIKARSGVYNQFEVQRGLPIQLLLKYFKQIDKDWHIKDELKAKVSFRKLNLIDDFTFLGKIDVIFCRNVLIYFDQYTKTSILNKMSEIMHENSFLFLGSSENIIGLETKLVPHPGCNGLFRKK